MRTVTALLAAAVAPLAVACGTDPPVVCGDAIPQQSVFVKEQKTVDVCFEDPGGLDLTVEASSSNSDIVATLLRGNSVGIAGVSPGEATVTAKATNSENLSVETSFSVLVPNRAPNFISTVDEASVVINRSVAWNLMEFFEEPDGEDMTFSATSSNTSAVVVTVDSSTAHVTGLSEGSSQVTLTATDPHGSEGSGTIEVTVKVPVTLLEDDFEDEGTLDDWEVPHEDMEASVQDGILRLRLDTDQPGRLSWAYREINEVTDFTIESTMIPVQGAFTCAFWGTGSEDDVPLYFFCLGSFTENRNWLLLYAPASGGNLEVAHGGDSDLIEFDEFGEYAVSLSGDNLLITVGGREIFDGTLPDAVPTMVTTGLTAGMVASEYDHIKVSGVLTSGSSADAPMIALPIVDRPISIRELNLPIKR